MALLSLVRRGPHRLERVVGEAEAGSGGRCPHQHWRVGSNDSVNRAGHGDEAVDAALQVSRIDAHHRAPHRQGAVAADHKIEPEAPAARRKSVARYVPAGTSSKRRAMVRFLLL